MLRGGLNDAIGLGRVVVMGVALRRVGVQGLRVPLMRLCRALGWRWRWGLAVGVVRMLVSVVVVMMLDVLAVMMSVRRMVMDAVVVSGCLRLGFG